MPAYFHRISALWSLIVDREYKFLPRYDVPLLRCRHELHARIRNGYNSSLVFPPSASIPTYLVQTHTIFRMITYLHSSENVRVFLFFNLLLLTWFWYCFSPCSQLSFIDCTVHAPFLIRPGSSPELHAIFGTNAATGI